MLVTLWFRQSKKKWVLLFLLISLLLAQVMVSSFFIQQRADTLINNSNAEDSLDVVFGFDSTSVAFDDFSGEQTSQFVKEKIAESHTITKEMNQISTFVSPITELIANTTLEALADLRSVNSLMVIVGDNLWANLNLSTGARLSFATAKTPMRFINNSIYVVVSNQGFRLNESEIEEIPWENAQNFLLKEGIRSTHEGIVFIHKEYYKNVIEPITLKVYTFPMVFLWNLFFDYSSMNIFGEIQTKYVHQVFDELATRPEGSNLSREDPYNSDDPYEGVYNLFLETPYKAKIDEISNTVVNSVFFFIVALNTVMFAITGYVMSSIKKLILDWKTFRSKSELIFGKNFSFYWIYLQIILFAGIFYFPVDLGIGIVYNFSPSFHVFRAIALDFAFMFLLNVLYYLIHQKLGSRRGFLALSGTAVLLFLSMSQFTFPYLLINTNKLMIFTLFYHIIITVYSMLIELLEVLISRSSALYKFHFSFTILRSILHSKRSLLSFFYILGIVLSLSVIVPTQVNYYTYQSEFNVGSDWVVSGFANQSSALSWVRDQNISEYSMHTKATVAVLVTGVRKSLTVLAISPENWTSEHYFSQDPTMKEGVNALDARSGVLIDDKSRSVGYTDTLLIQGTNTRAQSFDILGSFSSWPGFLTPGISSTQQEIYLITTFDVLEELMSDAFSIQDVEYSISIMGSDHAFSQTDNLTVSSLTDVLKADPILKEIHLISPYIQSVAIIFSLLLMGFILTTFSDETEKVVEIYKMEGYGTRVVNVSRLSSFIGVSIFSFLLAAAVFVLSIPLLPIFFFTEFQQQFIKLAFDWRFATLSFIAIFGSTFILWRFFVWD